MSALSQQFGGDAVRLNVAVGDPDRVVLGPLDVQAFTAFGIYVENLGGGSGDDLSSVAMQTAPTADGPWVSMYEILGGTLGSGDTAFSQYSDQANKYVRLTSQCNGGGDTTANFWFCASKF